MGGRALTAYWYASEGGSRTLEIGSPIILRFEGLHLEVWAIHYTCLGFSWNTIDLGRRPFFWRGAEARTSSCGRWRKNRYLGLAPALGARVRGVHLLSSDRYPPRPYEESKALCVGLRLQLGRSRFDFTVRDEDLWVSTTNPDVDRAVLFELYPGSSDTASD